jgi:hypothetical protein
LAGELRSPHAAGVDLQTLAVSLRVRVARRRAFKWNVELGAVESSAQSALVLNVLRLGAGGTRTWAAVTSHHSGGHARPPVSQQMAATSIPENTSTRPIGQLEATNELSQRIALSGER